MTQTWNQLIGRVPNVFDELENASPLQKPTSNIHEGKKGIYVFKDKDTGAVKHVGRTRNLKNRMIDHRSKSHNKATLAFKMTRAQTGKRPTYRPEGSREALLEDTLFYKAFIKNIEKIKKMDVYFVEEPSHEMQYLVELYACLKYELPTDEFDTT